MQHNIISNELHTATRTAATDTFALDENQREGEENEIIPVSLQARTINKSSDGSITTLRGYNWMPLAHRP